MALPEYPRVIYNRNPLAEVICQVRYTALPTLEAQRPVAFWQRIRDVFPYMEMREGIGIEAPFPLLPQIAAALPRHKSFEFLSEDDLWTLSLTKDYLALACRNYVRWEQFTGRLLPALDALQGLYKPEGYIRVGLRYLDVIQRSALGLTDVPWSDLLTAPLVGELAATELAADIEHVAREFVLRINDIPQSRVHVRHGFAQVAGIDEMCYLIDSDFYTGKRVEVQDAINSLSSFNRYAGRLFRWCITDRLHTAMEPSRV